MLRHSLPLLSSIALTSVLVACSGGTTTTSSGNPSPTGSSTSATDPPAKGSSGSSGSSKGSALGASCTAYVACCEEIAESTPQVAASCDAFKTQVESGQANGVATSSYEAACKSGLASFKSAGYCD